MSVNLALGAWTGESILYLALGLHLFVASFSCAVISALAATPAASARP
jgi:hypothetical protein